MKRHEYSQLLLRKAAQDEFVLCKLVADPEAPDEAIGFHGQQAAEKMIKAVLAAAAVPFRRTHDIAELLDTARDSGIEIPVELEELRWLTPFAVEFGCDDLPPGVEEPMDREWVLRCYRGGEAMGGAGRWQIRRRMSRQQNVLKGVLEDSFCRGSRDGYRARRRGRGVRPATTARPRGVS